MSTDTVLVNEAGQPTNEATGKIIPPQPSEYHVYDMAKDVWKDQRSNAKKDIDNLDEVLQKRQRDFPSHQELVEALYWQSKNKPGPMNALLKKVEDVMKERPKKGEVI